MPSVLAPLAGLLSLATGLLSPAQPVDPESGPAATVAATVAGTVAAMVGATGAATVPATRPTTARPTAPTTASTGGAGAPGTKTYVNPLAGRPWGTYEGPQELSWAPYANATGSTRRLLGYI